MYWLAAIVLAVCVLCVYLAFLYGGYRQKAIQAKEQVEDMANDAEIASKPFIDSPFSGMRGKD